MQTSFDLMAAQRDDFDVITFQRADLVAMPGLGHIADGGFAPTRSRLCDIGRGVRDARRWSGAAQGR